MSVPWGEVGLIGSGATKWDKQFADGTVTGQECSSENALQYS